MSPIIQPACLPMLIGSLPLDDHPAASRLVMDYTPAIPLWVQLAGFCPGGHGAAVPAGNAGCGQPGR